MTGAAAPHDRPAATPGTPAPNGPVPPVPPVPPTPPAVPGPSTPVTPAPVGQVSPSAPPSPSPAPPAGSESPTPKRRRRVTPLRSVVAFSALYLVAVPLPWIEGTSSVGDVSFTGIEVFVFGLCSLGAMATSLFGGALLRRRQRGAALVVTGLASTLSVLFVATAVVAIGGIKAVVNAVVPDELATASIGVGIWLVLLAAVGSVASVIWGLTQPDQLPEGAPLRRWLTLPAALVRAGREHLRAPPE